MVLLVVWTTGMLLSLPTSGADASQAEKAGILDGTLWEGKTVDKAWLLVNSIGRVGETNQIAKARAIALTFANTDRSILSREAMFALFRLGERKSFFLSIIGSHASNPKLAQYAILAMATDPSSEVLPQLATIEKETDDKGIRRAVARYRTVIEEKRRYMSLPTIDQKVDTLAHRVETGWLSLAESEIECEPHSLMNPAVVWARDELRRLSEIYPRAVSHQLRAFVVSRGMPEAMAEQFKQHLARHLGSQARELYFAAEKSGVSP